MSDREIAALRLTSEFISSENSLFKQLNQQGIPNLIERSQFNKRRRKLIGELAEPDGNTDFALKTRTYFEGKQEEESAEFLRLINNRLRNYIILKIISIYV